MSFLLYNYVVTCIDIIRRKVKIHGNRNYLIFFMKCFWLIIIVSLLGQKIGWGQVINGQVIDEETEQVLSYVNIGVVELGIGTVSDKWGKFSLQISEGTADSVLFSAVGYSSRKVAITDLKDDEKVRLTSRSYEMQSFEVVGKGGGRDKTFGIKKGIPAGYTNLASNKPGDEIGTPIKIRKPTYLKSAHFTIERVSGDSMIYRVNIYKFNDGEIGRNLVSENVLLEGVQKQGVVSVDLTPFELVISEDVLLTLENIQVDNEEHNFGIGFRYKSVFFRNRNIYGRIGDNSKNLDGEFSEIIQGSALNFYFVGNEL